MQQPTTEERLAQLEKDVAGLKLQRAIQETRDIALLARIDTFIDDLRRIERVQMKAFDSQALQLKEVRDDIKQIQETQTALVRAAELHEKNIVVLGDAGKEHKAVIEKLHEGQQALQAGQEQILAILTGKAKTND